MIKYIKEITTPAGAVRPLHRPEFKHVYDARDAIIAKYSAPGSELNVTTRADMPDGSVVTTVTMMFESVEQFNKCFDELALENQAQAHVDGESTTVASFQQASGIERRYQLRDATTDEVVLDWTTTGR
jgi:hypothetical protein